MGHLFTQTAQKDTGFPLHLRVPVGELNCWYIGESLKSDNFLFNYFHAEGQLASITAFVYGRMAPVHANHCRTVTVGDFIRV